MLLLDALPLSLCVGIFQRVSRELGLLAFLAGEESGWESPPFEASVPMTSNWLPPTSSTSR